jgi:hypothetical protein
MAFRTFKKRRVVTPDDEYTTLLSNTSNDQGFFTFPIVSPIRVSPDEELSLTLDSVTVPAVPAWIEADAHLYYFQWYVEVLGAEDDYPTRLDYGPRIEIPANCMSTVGNLWRTMQELAPNRVIYPQIILSVRSFAYCIEHFLCIDDSFDGKQVTVSANSRQLSFPFRRKGWTTRLRVQISEALLPFMSETEGDILDIIIPDNGRTFNQVNTTFALPCMYNLLTSAVRDSTLQCDLKKPVVAEFVEVSTTGSDEGIPTTTISQTPYRIPLLAKQECGDIRDVTFWVEEHLGGKVYFNPDQRMTVELTWHKQSKRKAAETLMGPLVGNYFLNFTPSMDNMWNFGEVKDFGEDDYEIALLGLSVHFDFDDARDPESENEVSTVVITAPDFLTDPNGILSALPWGTGVTRRRLEWDDEWFRPKLPRYKKIRAATFRQTAVGICLTPTLSGIDEFASPILAYSLHLHVRKCPTTSSTPTRTSLSA